jgi:WD40 repeat protein
VAKETDRHGDALPAGAITRLGTQRFRHLAEVQRVVFAPDGKTLAVSSRVKVDYRAGSDIPTDRIGLWETASGKELYHFDVRGEHPCLAFAPDGKTLAVVGNGPIGLFEVPSRNEVRGLWDVASGKELRQLLLESSAICTELAFSPDGRLLAARLDDALVLFDLRSGKVRRRLGKPPGDPRAWRKRPEHPIRALAFAPDGKLLASGTEDGAIGLWDMDGREVRRFGQRVWDASVAFSPGGQTLAVWSDSEPLRLYGVATGKERPRLECQDRHFQAAFSPDGRTLASWGDDHVLCTWDLATGKVRRRIELPAVERRGWRERVSVAFAPDGRTLASWGQWGHDDVVRLWDVATGWERFPFPGHGRHIVSVAFTPDGKALATASDQEEDYLLWDPLTGQQIGRRGQSAECTRIIGFTPEGKLLAAGREPVPIEDRPLYHWTRVGSAPDKKLSSPIAARGTYPYWRKDSWFIAVTILPGTGVVAGADQMRETQIHGDGMVLHNSGGADPLPALSSDGRYLAAAGNGGWDDDHVVRLWEVEPGREARRLIRMREWVGPPEYISFLTFAPDGRTLASVHQFETICVWEVASGKERCRFRAGPEGVRAVAFSPDGTLLASAGRRTHTALVWDVTGLRTGERTRAVRLSPADLEALWSALADPDAATAWKAVVALSAAPGLSVPLLTERLAGINERLEPVIRALDANEFRRREEASRELESWGGLAERQLRRAHEQSTSLEVRRRVERLLLRLQDPVPAGEALRALRAVEVLERVGGSEARRVLEQLAREHPDTPLGRDAGAAVRRLGKRPSPPDRRGG